MTAPDIRPRTDGRGRLHWCPNFCMGVLMSCGHSWTCAADPEIDRHRCGASYTNALWSLFLAVAAIGLVIAWRFHG